MKKKIKKNSRYNGRNVFGERCIAKFVTLEKATATEQYIEILEDIYNHPGDIIEYTFTLSNDFNPSEAKELYRWIDKISALYATAKEKDFCRLDAHFTSPFPTFQ